MNSIPTQKRDGAGLRSLALVFAALLCTGPVHAEDPGENPVAPGGGAGTSGTLPSVYGSGGLPTGYRIALGPALKNQTYPSITLRGRATELNALITSVHSPAGNGTFRMSPTAPDGTVTIHYYGSVSLDLDYAAYLKGQSAVGLGIPPAFKGGVAAIKVNGIRRATQVLRTGNQDLQLHRLANNGLLDLGVQVKSFDPTRSKKSKLTLTRIGQQIRLEQSQ